MITIDKGIPMPTDSVGGRGNKSPARLALEALGVGDSFTVPEGMDLTGARAALRPRVFSVRKGEVGGPRCWRTA